MRTNQSLARALAILDAIAKTPGGRLAAIAATVHLPAATTHRFLRDLTACGMLRPVPGGGHAIGERVLRLAAARPPENGLIGAELAGLAAASGLTAYLAVREGDEALYLHRAAPPASALAATARIGHRAPLYCTGVGKALLSACSEDEIRAYCRRTELIPYTSSTPRSQADLLRRIAAIRRCGYARDAEECEQGVACTAVLVSGGRAALSLSGAATRFDAAAVTAQAVRLASAARRIAELPEDSWR
jgi:DNA-binding IclR family transcriptional regulator